MKTYAPSATNRLAVARPMPLFPPVTTATLLSSFPLIVETPYRLVSIVNASCDSLVRRAACFADFETPDQERQRQARQHDQSQQVKTIHERDHRRLLSHHVSDHSVCLM